MTDVLEQLATLSPDQLREAEARIQYLRNPTGTVSAPITKTGSEHADMLARLFSAKFGREIPAPVLGNITKGKFNHGVDVMSGFVRDELKPKHRADWLKAFKILCAMIVGDLGKRHIPLAPRTFAMSMVDIAAVVDRHLPGYRACNMLHLVLLPGRSSE